MHKIYPCDHRKEGPGLAALDTYHFLVHVREGERGVEGHAASLLLLQMFTVCP